MPTERDPYDGWEDEPTPLRLASKRVLVAEDDPELRWLVAGRLRANGCDVVEAPNGARAVDLLAESAAASAPARRFELAIMDVRMPGMSGLEVVYLARTWNWPTAILLVTAFPDPELLGECARLEVPVLQKPFSLGAISSAALAALQHHRRPHGARGVT